MKTNLLTGFLLLFLLCACSSKEETLVTITVEPTSITLPGIGGEKNVTITTTANWTVENAGDWLTVTKENATVLKVKATSANMNSSNRSTVVTIIGGSASTTLNVIQGTVSAQQSDSLALVALYNATAGANWKSKWTLTAPMALWSGVTVTNNRVTQLKLPNNKLTGTLPPEIGLLTELQWLDLHENSLSGALPAGISNLTNLRFLDVNDNQLSGAVPALNNLTKLKILDLSYNKFTALTSTLSPLVLLEYLSLCKNNFSGSLPADWKNLVQLNCLDVSSNSFTGPIPTEWSALTKMEVFCVCENALNGPIPAYLPDFTELRFLAMDCNNFTENIPLALGDIVGLEELWLAHNRLTGTIPNSLLDNKHWNTVVAPAVEPWAPNVCPQQDSYAFDNCSANGMPQTANRKQQMQRIKAQYKLSK